EGDARMTTASQAGSGPAVVAGLGWPGPVSRSDDTNELGHVRTGLGWPTVDPQNPQPDPQARDTTHEADVSRETREASVTVVSSETPPHGASELEPEQAT